MWIYIVTSVAVAVAVAVALADELIGMLQQCGLNVAENGNTYLADRLSEDENSIQSAIDHTYYSQEIKNRVLTSKLEISSADHVPIKIIMLDRATNKVKQSKKEVKRSMKHFNQTNLNL